MPKQRVMLPPQLAQHAAHGAPPNTAAGTGGAYGTAPGSAAAAGPSSSGTRQAAAFEEWRQAKARELGVFPHSLASAEQARQLAAALSAGSDCGSGAGAGGERQQLLAAVAEVLGSRKAELYGEELLEAAAVRYQPLQPLQPPAAAAGALTAPAGTSAGPGMGPSRLPGAAHLPAQPSAKQAGKPGQGRQRQPETELHAAPTRRQGQRQSPGDDDDADVVVVVSDDDNSNSAEVPIATKRARR
jgi:hypothetical protein